MVHFQIAFPAGTITGPVIVKNRGASIAVAPVTINLVHRGLPKVLLYGNLKGMSTPTGSPMWGRSRSGSGWR